jgi:hypothetical protein
MPFEKTLKFIAKKIVQIIFYSSTALLSMLVILTIIGVLFFYETGTKGISPVDLKHLVQYIFFFLQISVLTYLLLKKALKNW